LIGENKILISALFLSAFFLTTTLFGQNNILELLPGSERLEYDQKTGIHSLYGNVNFRYQNNVMFCDSAHYHQRTEEIYAYGNVHINKRDTLNLYCDSLYYNGKSRKAKLWGNVRVRDNAYKLSCDSMDYDARSGQASYTTGGLIESILDKERLSSRIGYFHPETKNFFFSKNVKYTSDAVQMTTDTLRYLYSKRTAFFYGPTNIYTDSTIMYCESGQYNTETQEGRLIRNATIQRKNEFISGDTLDYIPSRLEYIGRGNVFYYDSLENISFSGNYAYNSDSLNLRLLTGCALVSKYMDDDTLHIHADTLRNTWNDSVDIIEAWNDAWIFSDGVSGKADSMLFNKIDSTLNLIGEPVIWSNKAELKGREIEVLLNENKVHTAIITERASIIFPVVQDLYYNQIYGNEIVAYFDSIEVRRADVFGNAITIAFPEEEDRTDSTLLIKRVGMNRVYSSDIRVDLDSSDIVGIAYLQKPDGKFYPMKAIQKSEQFIPDFMDKSALKPKSIDDFLD
jgi:lipopolysaccharide export system protein LptA